MLFGFHIFGEAIGKHVDEFHSPIFYSIFNLRLIRKSPVHAVQAVQSEAISTIFEAPRCCPFLSTPSNLLSVNKLTFGQRAALDWKRGGKRKGSPSFCFSGRNVKF
jgi:hypothetical protein